MQKTKEIQALYQHKKVSILPPRDCIYISTVCLSVFQATTRQHLEDLDLEVFYSKILKNKLILNLINYLRPLAKFWSLRKKVSTNICNAIKPQTSKVLKVVQI